MPTDFTQNDFNNGDLTDVEHIKRTFDPINDLEDGSALYSPDTGAANAYKVDFSSGNAISALQNGQVVNFRAANPNTGASTLTITGPSGDLTPVPLVKKGNTALDSGDIVSDQAVSAIYFEDAGATNPRFEILGGVATGGGGSTDLNGLIDVTLSSPAQDQILQRDASGQFVNRDLSSAGIATGTDISSLQTQINGKADDPHTHAISDITNLQASLDAKQDTLTGTLDVPGLDTALAAKQDNLTGTSDVPGLDTALAGKSDTNHTHDTTDIVSGTLPVTRGGTGGNTSATARTSLDVPSNADLTSGLAAKQDTSEKDAVDGYAGLDSSANVPIAHGGTGAGTATAARTNLDVPSNADLTSGLAAKQDTAEKDAVDGYAGLDSSANVPVAHGGTGASTAAAARTNLDVPSNADLTSGLAAKQDTSEKDAVGGYAGLDSSANVPVAHGGTGADLSSTGGTGQVLKQTTLGGPVSVGALSASEMPSGIDAAKISSGNVSGTEFDYLNGVTSGIQGQLDGKATISHAHDASDITSGTLPFGRGGTGMSSISANKLVGSGYSSNALQEISIGSGLSLYGGTLTNTRSSGVSGYGSGKHIAIWSSSSYLTYSQSYPLYLKSPQNIGLSGGILYWRPSDGQVFMQYSRAAHKTKIEKLSTTIDELMEWNAVRFRWKEAFGGEQDIGLIAEEVAELCPRATFHDKPWKYTNEETGEYELDEEGAPLKVEGEEVPAGVKYEKAWIPMLAAVQDFYRKYQELERKFERLEAQVGGKQ